MLQEEHQEHCVYNASDYFHYSYIQLVGIKFMNFDFSQEKNHQSIECWNINKL